MGLILIVEFIISFDCQNKIVTLWSVHDFPIKTVIHTRFAIQRLLFTDSQTSLRDSIDILINEHDQSQRNHRSRCDSYRSLQIVR